MVAQLVNIDETGTIMVAAAKPGRSPTEDDIYASSLAEKLGLEIQALLHKDPDGVAVRFAHCRMMDDELEIWRAFMPTRYAAVEEHAVLQLKKYRFDLIPLRLLEYWDGLKTAEKFDRFEIWTTENSACGDPALVGIANDMQFLLARWGRDAPDVLSLEKIKELLRARELQQVTDRTDYFDKMAGWRIATWFFGESTGFAIFFALSYAVVGWEHLVMQLVLSATIPMIPTMFIAHWMLKKLGVHDAVQRRLARKRNLWQTLDRHDALAALPTG